MRNSVTILFSLIMLAFLEQSLIHALPFPINTIPLTFGVGMLVLYRISPIFGLTWFFLLPWMIGIFSSPSPHPLPFIGSAVLGYFGLGKLFSRQSLYGFIGLGLGQYTLFGLFTIAVDSNPLGAAGSFAWTWSFMWLAFLLPFIYICAKRLRLVPALSS